MLISVCRPRTTIAGRMESRKRENQIWHNLEREPEIYNYENEWVRRERERRRNFPLVDSFLFALRYFFLSPRAPR